ncbi:MAG: peptide deformylase [Bdellovibrionales bacterium]|nr:peptide deformylase [Bdellovibrionales bacterium]
MTLLPIFKYPEEVLRQECEEVTDFDKSLCELLDNMAETMYEAQGIGLAAPQIGVTKQVTVIDVSSEEPLLIEFINPTIVAEEGATSSEEGCLSIPEYRESVKRSENIVVEAFDRTGKPFRMDADGLLSICLQHEIDHLHGILFIDHLSRLKREMFKRWYKKQGGFDE